MIEELKKLLKRAEESLPKGEKLCELIVPAELVREIISAQPEEDWIPVDKDMPDEYDSIFTRFHGTDKWRDGMWLKSSAKVLVTVEFEDGTRLTETAKTIDGKWATENRIRKRKVVAWKKMPKEYKGK